MKYCYCIFFFIMSYHMLPQQANDCVNAIIVCGNSNVNSDLTDFGIQEITGLGCSSEEHNSLWLEININSPGTLGFTLIPDNTSIVVDYDFWIFGPDATCESLGLPIRCSTTNPELANLPNNFTGLNATSIDTTEGPAADGDSFLKMIDAVTGEKYFIVLDRPIGEGGFSLQWTGTAGLGLLPSSNAIPGSLLNDFVCDDLFPYDDGIESFNLFQKTPLIIGDQTDLNVTYHTSESDAILKINPLPSPYLNTQMEEIIYFRMTNQSTGCFYVSNFQISVSLRPEIVDSVLEVCDFDTTLDGFTNIILSDANEDFTNGNPNMIAQFYTNDINAENNINELNANSFQNTSNPQTLKVRVTDTLSGCYSISNLLVKVNMYQANNALLTACDDDGNEDGYVNFNLMEAESTILSGLTGNFNITYYATHEDSLMEINPLNLNYTNTTPFLQIIYARINEESMCYALSKVTLKVFELPNVETEHTDYYCLNSYPETLTISGGVIDDSPSNYYYLWSTGETTSQIMINVPGNYNVRVTNTDGCFKDRTVTVLPSNIANITNIEVVDGVQNNMITVLVSGEGNYEYALDNLNGPYQDSNLFENVLPGLHTVYVRDKYDCGIVDELVSVIGFPKFFTPNNDGYNDYWQVYGITSQFYKRTDILIFDRFGKLLKKLDPLSSGWDGTFHGKELPSNDYWFSITLEDGRTFKSHFTLKR